MKDKLEAVEAETKKAGNPAAKAAPAMTAQEVELRKRVIEEMDDDLREVYERELKAYQEFRDDMISFNYDRGCAARAVRSNPKMGDKAVERLSTALSVDKSTVYKTITFSSMYSNKSELNKVVQRAKDSGFVITWSHFASVMHLPTAEDSDPHGHRRRYIDKAINEKLSVRELVTEVKAEFSGNTAKRTVNRGSEVNGIIKKVIDSSSRFQAKLKSQIEEVLTDFQEVVDKIDKPDEFLGSVEEMHETLVGLSSVVKRILVFTENLPAVTKRSIEARDKVKRSLAESEAADSLTPKSKVRRTEIADKTKSS